MHSMGVFSTFTNSLMSIPVTSMESTIAIVNPLRRTKLQELDPRSAEKEFNVYTDVLRLKGIS